MASRLQFYDASGALIAASTITIPGDAALGQTQRTVLFATAEAAALGGGATSPDFSMSSTDRMSSGGGAVCLTAASPGDCVTWGSIPPFPLLGPFPDRQNANAPAIANGLSLTRRITNGCESYLDAADDTADSEADFSPGSPTPRNNAATPTEVRCPPTAGIISQPANPSNSSTATFAFTELPSEPDVTFECELDGSGSFSGPETTNCDSGTKTYNSLSEGQHVFRVRATGENVTPGPPDSYIWTVDTDPPDTTITGFPASPSGGVSVTFNYQSDEVSSSFRCQLDSGAIQLCASTGKTYFNLLDGPHAFRVWATDNAKNQDASPAEYSFTVQTSLADLAPPDTSILLTPGNPSASASAFFAYASTEAASRFECRLGSAAFVSCPATGVDYAGLKNGVYTFEVRAIDSAGNIDSVPAAYTWTVAAPLPKTKITKSPPGSIRIKAPQRKAKVKIAFSGTPGSTFRCRLDKDAFKPCASTVTLKVAIGRHRFEVYSIDRLGNSEATPVRRIFRVQRQKAKGFF